MFTGSIVALVTPMDEKGNVCRSSMKKLIDYHVANGTSAIVSVGTTGESATLSHEEHGDVVMLTTWNWRTGVFRSSRVRAQTQRQRPLA